MKTHIDMFTVIVLNGEAREGHSELCSLARQSVLSGDARDGHSELCSLARQSVLSGEAREGHSELCSLARQSQSLAVRTQKPAILDGDNSVDDSSEV